MAHPIDPFLTELGLPPVGTPNAASSAALVRILAICGVYPKPEILWGSNPPYSLLPAMNTGLWAQASTLPLGAQFALHVARVQRVFNQTQGKPTEALAGVPAEFVQHCTIDPFGFPSIAAIEGGLARNENYRDYAQACTLARVQPLDAGRLLNQEQALVDALFLKDWLALWKSLPSEAQDNLGELDQRLAAFGLYQPTQDPFPLQVLVRIITWIVNTQRRATQYLGETGPNHPPIQLWNMAGPHFLGFEPPAQLRSALVSNDPQAVDGMIPTATLLSRIILVRALAAHRQFPAIAELEKKWTAPVVQWCGNGTPGLGQLDIGFSAETKTLAAKAMQAELNQLNDYFLKPQTSSNIACNGRIVSGSLPQSFQFLIGSMSRANLAAAAEQLGEPQYVGQPPKQGNPPPVWGGGPGGGPGGGQGAGANPLMGGGNPPAGSPAGGGSGSAYADQRQRGFNPYAGAAASPTRTQYQGAPSGQAGQGSGQPQNITPQQPGGGLLNPLYTGPNGTQPLYQGGQPQGGSTSTSAAIPIKPRTQGRAPQPSASTYQGGSSPSASTYPGGVPIRYEGSQEMIGQTTPEQTRIVIPQGTQAPMTTTSYPTSSPGGPSATSVVNMGQLYPGSSTSAQVSVGRN